MKSFGSQIQRSAVLAVILPCYSFLKEETTWAVYRGHARSPRDRFVVQANCVALDATAGARMRLLMENTLLFCKIELRVEKARTKRYASLLFSSAVIKTAVRVLLDPSDDFLFKLSSLNLTRLSLSTERKA
ncbi:MAG: hypothetical protein Q7S62_00710 [bacterium]|nr:hypothetical protein [bacterium]